MAAKHQDLTPDSLAHLGKPLKGKRSGCRLYHAGYDWLKHITSGNAGLIEERRRASSKAWHQTQWAAPKQDGQKE
jgi:hypothetical protein